MTGEDLKKELFLLRWNLLLLGICIAIAAALGMGTWKLSQQAQARYKQVHQIEEQSRNKANLLRSEEQDVREKIARYYEIVNRGILGGEKRLDWVDILRSIQKERKLLDLDYEIQPQQVMNNSLLSLPSPGHDFLNSAMRVSIPLLHEDDILHFIADLQQQAQAYIRVRECHLSRAESLAGPAKRDTETNALPPQLKSECVIEWITIREKK